MAAVATRKRLAATAAMLTYTMALGTTASRLAEALNANVSERSPTIQMATNATTRKPPLAKTGAFTELMSLQDNRTSSASERTVAGPGSQPAAIEWRLNRSPAISAMQASDTNQATTSGNRCRRQKMAMPCDPTTA